jgi:hypothetical protein
LKLNVNKETLEDLYVKQGLTALQIARHFSVSSAAIYKRLRLLGIPVIDRNAQVQERRSALFSARLDDLIIGSLLGDGHVELSSSRSARFEESHSIKQVDYLRWKAALFGGLVSGLAFGVAKIDGKAHQTCYLKSLSHPRFTAHHAVLYSGRVKVVKEQLREHLNPFVLAVWVMDDGCAHKNGTIRLHTDCFSLEDNTRLASMLFDIFGLSARIQEDYRSNNFHLVFNKTNAIKLSSVIEPYVVDSMKYKLVKSTNNQV